MSFHAYVAVCPVVNSSVDDWEGDSVKIERASTVLYTETSLDKCRRIDHCIRRYTGFFFHPVLVSPRASPRGFVPGVLFQGVLFQGFCSRGFVSIWDASGGIWSHLEASGRHLEAYGGIWRYLEASGRHLD